MSAARILIAGIGNIFFGDDAFGGEVARRLAQRSLPDGVRAVDYGIRGLDLAYSLLDDPEAVILVDAAPRGGQPGDLYVLQPEIEGSESDDAGGPLVEPHGLDVQKVLRLARSLGGKLERIYLVGCEPQPLPPDDDMRMDMSAPVRAAVEEAVGLVESLVERLRAGHEPCTNSRSH